MQMVLFHKNSITRMELKMAPYKGMNQVDIREHMDFHSKDEWHPTKRGINFPADVALIQELIDGLIQVLTEVQLQETAARETK